MLKKRLTSLLQRFGIVSPPPTPEEEKQFQEMMKGENALLQAFAPAAQSGDPPEMAAIKERIRANTERYLKKNARKRAREMRELARFVTSCRNLTAAVGEAMTQIHAAEDAEKKQQQDWRDQGCPTTDRVTLMPPLKLGR